MYYKYVLYITLYVTYIHTLYIYIYICIYIYIYIYIFKQTNNCVINTVARVLNTNVERKYIQNK